MMSITKARNIARAIERGTSETSRQDIRRAFHVLDRQRIRRKPSREERQEDYRLAKVIWDHVGTWDEPKPHCI